MTEVLDYQTFQEHAFAVVDARMVEQLPSGLVTEALVPQRLAGSAHLMPTLIDLQRTSRARSDALFKCMSEFPTDAGPLPPVALLLRTSASAAAIARHWNSMQLVEPRPGARLWLRLHDPRVLHQMLRVLSPAQRRRLFGPSQAFTYWVGGTWVSAMREMDDSPTQIAGNDPSPPTAAWAMAWNWKRIERIGLVNRALHGAGVVGASALTSQGALAEQLMERALKHGLIDQADLVEFATRGLLTNFGFDDHPVVSRAIPSSDGDSRLSDRFALIPEHVWTELRPTKPMQGEL
ncbi:DUF4123 domain-containing protein [Massilia haematophila]|uniref:DUF4123 domain-containing protein n=1 Tax=Massilia haematophila TaxID=457923 RepID=A0ABV7PTB6_9BURK|nr:hypothetical protein [Massilia sp.]